jgi:hypothetical protein
MAKKRPANKKEPKGSIRPKEKELSDKDLEKASGGILIKDKY